MLAVSLPALTLSMACAICFAASDYYRKVASEAFPPAVLLTVFVTGQIPLLGAWMFFTESASVSPDYWPFGLATAVTSLFANLLFLMAMRVSSLSLTVPVLALIPVLTTLFGAFALDEVPSVQQILGILVSVAGLFWLYLPEDNPRITAVIRRFIHDRGARYMIGVAVLWSATAPLDKTSVQLSTAAAHAFIQVCLISAVMIVYLVMTKTWVTVATVRPVAWPAALASVTAGIAYGCQLVAFQLTLIGVVESLKRVIGLLSALILGRILLNEPLTKHKFAGIALLVIGVPMIILPSAF